MDENIQWDKLSHAQQKIVKEVNERYRKKREKSRMAVLEKEACDRSKIIKFQYSLLRGDINIKEFKSKIQNLGYSPDFVFIKLDEVRQALNKHFGIDMDKERI